jgi:ribonucleoside-triphosphate reductase
MFTKIRKRDGKIVPFTISKIATAIAKAGKAMGEFGQEVADALAEQAVALALTRFPNKIPTVEEIQDIVEETLLASPYKATAKDYIIYRDQHAKVREIVSQAGIDLIDGYIRQLDWKVYENSNMAYSLQGLHNYIASETSKVYWLNKIYTPQIRQAHVDGDIHIHDLGILSVYCVGWDLMDLLTSGFRGVFGKVQSKPPKHLRTALGQVVNFFYTLQGEAAGAQAFSNFDTLLAPFIRYDGLNYLQVKQAMQEFIFNINVPTRVGFQTPFTNVTMDLQAPDHFADVPVMIGGVPQKETYKEFQAEMDMFNRAFFDVMTEGDGVGRVFTFPIPTYNITKTFNWDNPNLVGLWEMTAKFGIPYFSNFINSDMKPEDARSMCCRLRLDNRKLEKRGGALFGANPMTGSIGVVTINLPRLGYFSKTKELFIENLANVMDTAKKSLEVKRKFLEEVSNQNLYPYTKFYLRRMKERFGRHWDNHFSTIGILGMNEACLNLLGEPISSKAGKAFAEEVLDFMRDRITEYQEETKNLYNLEATPGEGTTYRFALADKRKYPDIIVANEEEWKNGAQPYYTNSTHLPVNYTSDLFEALDLQDALQTKYTGGTVVHNFLGERLQDTETTKQLVKRICESYRLPYFTLTPTFSVCASHGYIAGEHSLCPHCGEKSEVYSRVVGYLRPVQQWNLGKQAEFSHRTNYDVPENAACPTKGKTADTNQ